MTTATKTQTDTGFTYTVTTDDGQSVTQNDKRDMDFALVLPGTAYFRKSADLATARKVAAKEGRKVVRFQ